MTAIASHNPDVIALTEFRSTPGVAIRRHLEQRGWGHIESTDPAGSVNGICVLSRSPLVREKSCPAPAENAVRWLDVELPAQGFAIGALHILNSDAGIGEAAGAAKTRFWDAILKAAEARIAQPFLFIGDFNTGLHKVDEAGRTFYCAEHFARFSDLGSIDVWRHFNGSATEHTWFSHGRGGKTENGFRLDHAFVTPSLLQRVKDCRYSYEERESGASDHSILIVEIAPCGTASR